MTARRLRTALLLGVAVCFFAAIPLAGATSAPAFVTKWGASGSGDGQFQFPVGVAVDGSGNVYVVDNGNSRIQKFDSSGSFLAKWDSFGSGDGQFYFPQSVGVDGSGNVYVADGGLGRIQKFDSSGTFLAKWGSSGSGDGQFNNPYGVAVDGSGNVYVADGYNYRIQKFDSSGSFLTKWGSSGSGDGQFNVAAGIAVDGSGNVYVADIGNSRIQKFDSSGGFLAKWGSYGSGDGQFECPQGVAVDDSGNVYVADNCGNRIQVFDSSGSFLTKWGSPGSGDGQFNVPGAIAVDGSGNVYVADTANNRIQKFSQQSDDTTPPATTIGLDPATPDGQNGWYVSTVNATVSAVDSEGSVAETRCELDLTGAPASFDDIPAGCAYTGAGAAVSGDGTHTIHAASSDDSGNEEAPVSASFMIDQSDPTVTCDIAYPGPVFVLGGPGGNVTATVNDPSPGSGAVATSLSDTADVSSVGSKTVSLTGEDAAGNETTVGCPYQVVYDFLGFFQPVDNLPTMNSVKAGAAVPVKFSLDGFQGLDIFAAGYPRSELIGCDSTAQVDGIEETVTSGSSSLSYDSALDRYTYVWKTNKAWANTCRQLVVKLSDGTFHRANFKLK